MEFGKIEYSSPICVIKMPDICQLKCKYCFREYNKKPELIKYLGEDINNLLQKYPEILTISFLGGEPLLFEKEIRNIIDATKHRIKKYIITTNGLNLTEQNIKYFIDNHVQINISLDGNREDNDFNRGAGVYDKVIENIEILYKIAPKNYFWTISSTFTKDTIKNMYKNYLHIRSITPKGWAINLDKYAEWSEKDLEIISNELLKIKNHYNTHPRTLKWFLDRISENNIIYNHSDHIIVHQNGEIYQGFPFSKEILNIQNFEKIKLGNLNNLNNLKPITKWDYSSLRPCISKKCKNCPLGYRTFYPYIKESHANLLCTVYSTLLNFNDRSKL